MEEIKNSMYNEIIGSYSKNLYKSFFEKIPNNSCILDVGIGNGYAICENSEIIIEKNLKIVGIDIDFNSILTCRTNINKSNLNKHIYPILCELDSLDVYFNLITKFINNISFNNNVNNLNNDFNSNNSENKVKLFNYVFYSNSYSVIPNILDLLNTSKKYLKNENSEIVICTTIENKHNEIKNYIKKNIKYVLLGIDFGRLVTLNSLKNEISKINLEIVNQENTINRKLYIWGNISIDTFYCKVLNNFSVE